MGFDEVVPADAASNNNGNGRDGLCASKPGVDRKTLLDINLFP